jgi:putative ABC transport system ATP-binding protein
MASLVETENLGKVYPVAPQPVMALSAVTLSIGYGEFAAVMGPSGSGKSTFMNLLGCLDTPSSGSLRLDGEEVGRLDATGLATLRSRKIGFVFQSFNLLGRTTALGNAELPLIYHGIERRLRRERARSALERVGLADRLHHMPNQLSGGQQQRVAIARALVNDPLLLLADEPTGALDTRTSLEIMALFQELNRGGITVLLVTHEPEMARFAGRLIRFRDGRLVSDERQPPADARELLQGLPAETGSH